MEGSTVTIDESTYQKLKDKAESLGYNSVDEFLAAVGDGKNFNQGCLQPDNGLSGDGSISHASGCKQPGMTTFCVTFECTKEFLDKFRSKAQFDNRTLKGQFQQLAEDYAGMKAIPAAV